MIHASQKTALGILFVILGSFAITSMNALAKLASEEYDPIEIVFYRGIIGFTLCCVYIIATRQFHILKTKRPKAHLLRSLTGTLSITFVFWAYSLMPIANVTAILLTSGLIVTALSAPFLGEKVGSIRWAAVFCGLVGGGFIVARDMQAGFSLLALCVAFFAAITVALVSILLRSLGQSENPLTTILYFFTTSVVTTGIYVLPVKGFDHHALVWPLMLGIGLFAFLQQIMKTLAYQFAEASVLSPFGYLIIVWAMLFSVLIWQEWPPAYVYLGASLIIGSNLVVYMRERSRKE